MFLNEKIEKDSDHKTGHAQFIEHALKSCHQFTYTLPKHLSNNK